MKYDNAELMGQLGAEYVIGTLRGAARRRYQRLMDTHPEARAQAEFWEQRLSEFGQALHPVLPPASLRAAMLDQACPALPVQPGVGSRRDRRRANRRLWRIAGGFAAAASLVLAFLAGQQGRDGQAPDGRTAQLNVTVPGTQHAGPYPMYSAQLRMPASSMQWLVSISEDHKRLDVVAAEDFLQVGRHTIELWCVPPGGEPIALGALPYERDASTSFDIPEQARGHDELRFMVTLEREGGARDRPGTAVLHEARALAEI